MKTPDLRAAFPSVRKQRAQDAMRAEITADLQDEIAAIRDELAALHGFITVGLSQTAGYGTNGVLQKTVETIASGR